MKNNREMMRVVTTNASYSFRVECPESQSQKEKGLMDALSIEDDYAMLFLADWEQPMRMWMKGTKISLDMLFVRNTGIIHRIEESAAPNSERKIWSHGFVKGVVEVKGGMCKKLDIKPGDYVEYPLFK